MIDNPPARDIPRITLSVIAIGGLMAAAIYVISPFVPALVWATTIVVATWPVLIWLQKKFGGRRGPAVAVMTGAILALLVVPLYVVVSALVSSADRISELVSSLSTAVLPPPPEWVKSVPLAGPRLDAAWQRIAEGGHAALVADLGPYISRAARGVASQAGALGAIVVQFLLTTLVAAVLFATGEEAGLGVRRFFRRLAGARGDGVVVLAGKAIRAVAMGVVVTAIVQTTMAGIGLAVAGVPRAGLLTAVTLILCIAQLGPALILAPAVIWLFSSGQTGMGILLLVWSVGTVAIDNVLRPVLIKMGADLPLWLILSGVIGGLLAFGVIGLFIGPVLLAVTYTLVQEWVADLGPEPAEPGERPEA